MADLGLDISADMFELMDETLNRGKKRSRSSNSSSSFSLGKLVAKEEAERRTQQVLRNVEETALNDREKRRLTMQMEDEKEDADAAAMIEAGRMALAVLQKDGLGPPMPPQSISLFRAPNEKEMQGVESKGLAAVLAAFDEQEKEGRKSDVTHVSQTTTTGEEADVESQQREIISAYLSGGWLCAGKKKGDNCSKECLKGLFDVITSTSDRILAHHATKTLCSFIRSGYWAPSIESIFQALRIVGYLQPTTYNPSEDDASACPEGGGNGTKVPFNVKSILILMQVMGSNSKQTTVAGCERLIEFTLHLFLDRGADALQPTALATLGSLLYSLNEKDWKIVSPKIASIICGLRPSSLAVVHVIQCVKRSLAAQGAGGVERWSSFCIEIAQVFLNRLGFKTDKEGIDGILDMVKQIDTSVISSQESVPGPLEHGWAVLSVLNIADTVLSSPGIIKGDFEEESLESWLEFVRSTDKGQRTTRTLLEQQIKSTLAEFSSRYEHYRLLIRRASSAGLMSSDSQRLRTPRKGKQPDTPNSKFAGGGTQLDTVEEEEPESIQI